jgi:hypothetical protein
MRGLAVALIAAAAVAASVRWGSFVAGGSDSYCYVHQAERWADALLHPFAGRLHVVEPLANEAPWPDAAATFVPVGHIASPTVPGAIAPICPPGLSLAMAPFVMLAGPRGAFAVVPLLAALLVVATYAAGSRFGARIGVAAAVLVAASPIFLYQVVQPMSDVPAAALWMLAAAFATGTGPRHAALGGLATAGAILMRPNLVPLGFVIGLFLLLRPERTRRQRVTPALHYAIWSAAGCIAVALIQWAFFGSALSSGYGSFDSLFAASNVGPNFRSYPGWLWASHTPAIALAALSSVLLPGALTTLFLALFGVNLALYLPYVRFEDWSYLRFLLPTIPLLIVLMVAVVDAICRRWIRLRDTRLILAVTAAVLAVVFVREARDRQVFRLQRMESRFERAGRYAGERLPPNAIVFTIWHSGSVRFYGGRKTLVWDALDPAWLDRAIDYVRTRGYDPYFLFEGQEEQLFRERFRGSALGALDWPPSAEILGQIRIFRPEDRARYLKGDARPTDYVR